MTEHHLSNVRSTPSQIVWKETVESYRAKHPKPPPVATPPPVTPPRTDTYNILNTHRAAFDAITIPNTPRPPRPPDHRLTAVVVAVLAIIFVLYALDIPHQPDNPADYGDTPPCLNNPGASDAC